MQITRKSLYSGNINTREIPITFNDYDEWLESGQFVQDAFPQLSAEDREFLINGLTPEECDEIFGDIEDDELDDYTGYNA